MKRIFHKARHAHRRLVGLPVLIILLLSLAAGWLSVRQLRQNNLRMIELRQSVIDADNLGDAAIIEQSLQSLQLYVARHMNTSTRVELRGSYQRDARKHQQEALAQLGHVELYNRAETECQNSGVSGSLLAQCINDRLTGEAGDIVKLPDARLYKHEFLSPYFSFDVAGVTLIALGVFVYAGLFQLVRGLIQSRTKRPQPNAKQTAKK